MTSDTAELLKASIEALDALRSYQHGNSSPDLAEEVANHLETAITAELEGRDRCLEFMSQDLSKLQTMLYEIRTAVDTRSPVGTERERN